jgi:hypothetical protein
MSNDTKSASRFAVAFRMTAIPMIAFVAFAETVRFVAGDAVAVVGWPVPPTNQYFYTAYLVTLVVSFVLNYLLTGTEEFNA